MSLRLTVTAFFLLAYSYSQAQKDSVWQTLKHTTSQIKKSESTVAKYNTKTDSIIQTVQDIPLKYIKQVDDKIEKYSDRITNKTEKTLTKLSKWENKIKSLLEKASPETAQKLFAPNQLTFTSLLQKLKDGESVAQNYKATYNEYRDKLTTNLKYIETQKDKLNVQYIKPAKEATEKIDQLEKDVANTEAVEKFIKERKKQLFDEAVKYIGKSKYLTKIDKESYYYFETLKNYKEIFSDPKKTEETAVNILNKIPAFKEFVSKNSMLASLFGSPSTPASAASLAGLQTRAGINNLIQNQIGSGGPNLQNLVSQNLNQAQGVLNELKDKVAKAGGTSSDAEIPAFKPKEQRSKTFLQRLEFGTNFQTAKGNSLLPVTADLALSLGYKINDKSVIGIGASYRMGLGSIQKIKITHEGIGIRSFIDWKLKKQFFISGGFEMNYNAQFKNISELNKYNDWQQAGLVGLSKKINKKGKWFKGTTLQLLYDVMYRSHIPVSQPVIFRTGFTFK